MRRGVESVLLVRGSGPFARQVIEGAEHDAAIMGLRVDVAELASWRVPASLAGRGLLIAGTFDQGVDAVRQGPASIESSSRVTVEVGLVARSARPLTVRTGLRVSTELRDL